MKTIEEIKAQPPVFLHNFTDAFDVISEFNQCYMSKEQYNSETSPYPNKEHWEEKKRLMKAALDRHAGENILFASYGTDNYSGDSWVLFEKNGKLYEVSGSHCSCMGLEGQWDPSEVVLDELANRLKPENKYFGKDSYSDNEFAEELKQFLGIDQPPR